MSINRRQSRIGGGQLPITRVLSVRSLLSLTSMLTLKLYSDHLSKRERNKRPLLQDEVRAKEHYITTYRHLRRVSAYSVNANGQDTNLHTPHL